MDIGTYATQTNSMHPGMVESRETSLFGVLEMHSKWQGAANDRIHVWFGPRTPGGVTSELYREVSDSLGDMAHQGGGEIVRLGENKALLREVMALTFGTRWRVEMAKYMDRLQ